MENKSAPARHVYVTESDIPYNEAFYMPDRFVYLNMYPDGIWYVDKQHSKINKIKETALIVARTLGDKAAVEEINTKIP